MICLQLVNLSLFTFFVPFGILHPVVFGVSGYFFKSTYDHYITMMKISFNYDEKPPAKHLFWWVVTLNKLRQSHILQLYDLCKEEGFYIKKDSSFYTYSIIHRVWGMDIAKEVKDDVAIEECSILVSSPAEAMRIRLMLR